MGVRGSKRASEVRPKVQRGTSQTSKPRQLAEANAEPQGPVFPVVGIGASAGGLEAFTTLLKSLPRDTGMAFVLVQHMDPAHESALSRILSRATEMPVDEVADGTVVEPNHVYVIPSNADLTLRGGVLRLSERREVAGRHLPVDRFLCSLAEDRASSAIGVILSGTASDGTQGLRAIKAEGGVTFAQDEHSARHAGMPQSAVAAACVDFVLPPEKIAEELARIGRHPYVAVDKPLEGAGAATFGGNGIRQICLLLRSSSGVDFLQYKPATITRRIGRRMALQKIESMQEYLQMLRKTPSEVEALYQDILVHVTGFFRDPEAFRALRTKVLPSIMAHKAPGQPVRIWVPGCSTGEEVYSIAVLLLEAVGDQDYHTKIQVFGTDISEPAIQQARQGIYPEAALAHVSAARLRKYFVKTEGGYQVSKQVREVCVFARHDVTKDPPFSNMDLVSCRNVLIYLGAALQEKTIQVFHYALRTGGYLFLGNSESLAAHQHLFAPEDRKYKLFTRRLGPSAHLQVAAGTSDREQRTMPEGVSVAGSGDLRKEAERILLERYAPAAVVVDPDLHIVQFQGDNSPYLAPAAGEASFHLLRMLRPELVVEVRGALHKARQGRGSAGTGEIRFNHDGRIKCVRVDVTPLAGRHANGNDFLVVFHEEAVPAVSHESPAKAGMPAGSAGAEGGADVHRLKRELASAHECLRSIVEDHEATYEELRAANEEVLSANEELQSTNEELETTKEELQSSNEELATLNEELQNRNSELIQLANDLSNLLVGVDIPIAIFDRDLRIRRFTPMAEQALNLIPGDVGRPFRHIAPNLVVSDWDELFSEVLDHVRTVEREVQDQQGHWYALRMRPYKTIDNRIDGVLLALLDIDPLKRTLEEARLARGYAEAIVETIREPLLVLNGELRVLTANPGFYQTFRVSAQETLGRSVFELGEGQWDIPPLRRLLEDLLPQDAWIDDFEVDHEFPVIGQRYMLLSARQIHRAGMGTGMILLAIRDLTEQRESTRALEASQARYRAIVEDQTELICRFLPDGMLTFVNDAFCRYFGATREELLGGSFLERLVDQEDADAIRRHLATDFAPDNPVMQFVWHYSPPDGPWRQWVTRAFFDAEGRIVEYQSAGRDITNMKRVEESLILYQEELRALTAKLLSAQEASSKHLARELHDVFSQKLAVLGMEIDALLQRPPKSAEVRNERLRQIGGQINDLAKEIHQMSRQLHPAILDDLGVGAALRNECLAFSEQYGILARCTVTNLPPSIPEDISLCLYRVAQESLRNIAKHSSAKEVDVNLSGENGAVVLVVEDLGDGFEIDDIRGKGRLGLVSMDERVRLVNGTFSLRSEPSRGTRIEVRVPLPKKEE